MLPKKRKFDLSKFELDRGEAGGAGTSHGLSPGPGPGGGSVTVTSVDRPGHQQRPPRAPEARALPASGFLTPETVHEAFAGNSYLKPASASSEQARSLMSGPGPPPVQRSGSSPCSSLSNTIVDLSHKQSDKHRSSVSVSVTPGPLSQYSAFSRHLPFPGALARLQPDLSPSTQSTQSFKRVAPAQSRGPGDPGAGVSVVLQPAVSASHKIKSGPAQHRWGISLR